MTISQLNDLYMEMEVLIREFSETLISELALRDELEYEKELKNTFISLLLAVQNKRRQFHVEKKKGKMQSSMTSSTQSLNGQNGTARPNGLSTSSLDPKYLTTVIPYHLDAGPPDNQALQVLIKSKKIVLCNFNDQNLIFFHSSIFSLESDKRGLANGSNSIDRLHPESSLSDVNTIERAYANLRTFYDFTSVFFLWKPISLFIIINESGEENSVFKKHLMTRRLSLSWSNKMNFLKPFLPLT